jgi:hypothetical protein
VLDGPLMDYAAQGTKVELKSIESEAGHNAYRPTHESGDVQHVWIDTKTFVDVRIEGMPRRTDDKMRTVWVMQRDLCSVQGLMVPLTLETAVDGF